MKIKYTQIKADPEIIEQHIDEAFDILFKEVVKQEQEKKLLKNRQKK